MLSMELVAGWGVTGAMIVGHIFVANYRIDRNEKEQEKAATSINTEINQIWNWKNAHDKEAGEMREKYQMQISELKGAQLVVGEQFKQIMSGLSEIKTRLDTLENNKNGRN